MLGIEAITSFGRLITTPPFWRRTQNLGMGKGKRNPDW